MGNPFVKTIREALSDLVQKHRMTHATHLMTIDVYIKEYLELRESIIEAFENRPARRQYTIVTSTLADDVDDYDLKRLQNLLLPASERQIDASERKEIQKSQTKRRKRHGK